MNERPVSGSRRNRLNGRDEGAKLTRWFAAANVRYPHLRSREETYRIVELNGHSICIRPPSGFGPL